MTILMFTFTGKISIYLLNICITNSRNVNKYLKFTCQKPPHELWIVVS